MGLVKRAVDKVVGQVLEVTPEYGWGWNYNWEKEPRTFQIEVIELITASEDHCIGGVGRIVSTESSYCGNYLMFELRVSGDFDFSESIGVYNLFFYREKPIVGKHFLGGYGTIAYPKIQDKSQ